MTTDHLNVVDPSWAWTAYKPSPSDPWNTEKAAHLYRRAGFSANWQTLKSAGHTDTDVDELLDAIFDAEEDPAFESSMNQIARTVLAGGEPQALSRWWLYRMQFSPCQLREKMTLFWHGHFATSAAKVRSSHLMHDQNRIFRDHALGDFGALTQAIARDPAMLIYLDSDTNRKSHPNENFARELMELFCMGEGNYTEQDIRELSRCFTGWEIRRDRFRFNRYQHDFGEKSIFGQTAKFSGEDAVQQVLDHPATARFIIRKLIRYFMFDEPHVPDSLVEPLANRFREANLDVGPVLRTMLASNLFFSKWSIARKIKSPVELALGMMRAFDATTNSEFLATELGRLDQKLFFPPNVKGWDGGRAWINSATLLGRANFVHTLLHHKATRFDRGKLADLIDRNGVRSDSETIIDWLVQLNMARPVSDEARGMLVKLHQTNGNPESALKATLHALSAVPEFQIA